MKIRAARATDAEAIASLWNDMIRDTLATFTTQEKSIADIAVMLTERDQSFWVVEDECRLLGFVTYGPFRSGPGYGATVEHTIVLGPDTQGQGIGHKIMQHALEGAHGQGHHVIVAAISGANPRAVAFHSRLGFEQVAHMPQVGRKGGQWLDLILMQKIISAS